MASSNDSQQAVPGSLYLAGFAQVGAPHVGLILAIDNATGSLFHITAAGATDWRYESRARQSIENSLTLTSLMCLHDASTLGALSRATVDAVCRGVPVPEGCEVGECTVWAQQAVAALAAQGSISLATETAVLVQQFIVWVGGNRHKAKRGAYPAVM